MAASMPSIAAGSRTAGHNGDRQGPEHLRNVRLGARLALASQRIAQAAPLARAENEPRLPSAARPVLAVAGLRREMAGRDDEQTPGAVSSCSESDNAIAVRAAHADRFVLAVLEQRRMGLPEMQQLLRQRELDMSVRPAAGQFVPLRFGGSGCLTRREIHRAAVVGIDQREVPELGALMKSGTPRHGGLQRQLVGPERTEESCTPGEACKGLQKLPGAHPESHG